jgi:hypothetical protein
VKAIIATLARWLNEAPIQVSPRINSFLAKMKQADGGYRDFQQSRKDLGGVD